jgi:hypothetical protein
MNQSSGARGVGAQEGAIQRINRKRQRDYGKNSLSLSEAKKATGIDEQSGHCFSRSDNMHDYENRGVHDFRK